MSGSPAGAEASSGLQVALVAPSSLLGSYPLDAVRARGCELHLIGSPERDPGAAELALAAARSARRRPLATWRQLRSPDPRERLMVARTIELSPAVLHLSSLALARDWGDVANAVGAPIVISVSPEEAAIVALDRSMSPPPGSALHVDDEQVAELLSEGPVQPGSITVIPPAPDPVLLRGPPSPAPDDAAVRILGVGPLSWTHGYEHALVALKLLLARGVDCRYRLVGAGAHHDAIAFARHQLGLDDHVELTEARSPAELREHLRWATVLLDASVIATSPQAELDARAAGVPVVTTRKEAGEDTALKVERRDPEGLCEALATLATDGERRARLVQAGRQRAESEPTQDEQAARLVELYQRVARRG
jgi:glycosyltransferase involved in cell wall biosynthesis